MGVLLGLDWGEKRVGVAVTDQSCAMALPLKVIDHRGREHFLTQLQDLIEQYRVAEVVVGLPKTLKGEIGPAAERVMSEVKWLEGELSVPCVLWDERLSTLETERMLREANVHHARRKEIRDAVAAQKILQNYVDFQNLRRHDETN